MKRLIVTTALLCPLLVFAKSNPYLSEGMSSTPTPHRMANVKLFVPGIFIGRIGGALEFRLNKSWSIGPTLRYWAAGDFEGLNAGVSASYALNRDLDKNGWLVNPYMEYVRDNYNSDGDDGEKETGIETGANLMYQWMWDTGVNIQAGIGIEYSSLERPLSLGDSDFHPNFEITLGYAF